jgi:uncharacterized membrane protein
MGLTIANGYTNLISVCIMFESPDTCSGEGLGWEMMGWWNINPNDSKLVYANDLEDLNRYWYYYAQAVDGRTWSGDGSWTASVPSAAFDQCYGIGISTGVEVNFRELDINSYDNFTLTLVE